MVSDYQPKLERGLRVASDSLLATLDELYALEEEKRTVEPGTERFVTLAGRVESLAEALLGHSRQQERLARASEGEDAPETRRIDEIPPRAIHLVLAEWRAAERRLEAADPESEMADMAAADIRRLRDEYRRARLVAESGGKPD
jgi:hypothetical protein